MLQTLKENTMGQSESWEANRNFPIREISAFMSPKLRHRVDNSPLPISTGN